MSEKRRDNRNRILHNGESQRQDGDIQTTLGIYTHSSYEQMEQEFKRIASV